MTTLEMVVFLVGLLSMFVLVGAITAVLLMGLLAWLIK